MCFVAIFVWFLWIGLLQHWHSLECNHHLIQKEFFMWTIYCWNAWNDESKHCTRYLKSKERIYYFKSVPGHHFPKSICTGWPKPNKPFHLIYINSVIIIINIFFPAIFWLLRILGPYHISLAPLALGPRQPLLPKKCPLSVCLPLLSGMSHSPSNQPGSAVNIQPTSGMYSDWISTSLMNKPVVTVGKKNCLR